MLGLFQGILNLVLMITVIGWPIAAVWALVVVNQWKTEQAQKKVVTELQRNTAALEAQNAAIAAQTAAAVQDRGTGSGPSGSAA